MTSFLTLSHKALPYTLNPFRKLKQITGLILTATVSSISLIRRNEILFVQEAAFGVVYCLISSLKWVSSACKGSA